MTVHGEREQHDIEEATFDQRKVEVVQAVTHVANVRCTDDPVTRQRSADGREGPKGSHVQFVTHFGRVLVDALHQQQQVFGERRNDFREFCSVNGLEGLGTGSDDGVSQGGINGSRRQMTDEQGDVRVGEWQHAVGSEDGGKTLDVQRFKQQHERHSSAFFPHWTALIAQTLGCLQAKWRSQRPGLEHMEESLIVNIVQKAEQPVVGSVAAQ